MSVSDPISDMLTKIRNASGARYEKVDIPSSKLKVEIVKILKNEGYVKTFKKISQDSQNQIRIFLKYDDVNNPVLHGLERMSTPGRRVYRGYKSMPRIFNGYGTLIVTTARGVITGRKAAEQHVGGELICSVW